MSAPTSAGQDPGSNPQRRPPIAWLELTCLACGEVAGYIENQRIVRAVSPGGIRLDRGQPRCGRCNALLLPGNSGVAANRGQIG